jgi:hypothetical protein
MAERRVSGSVGMLVKLGPCHNAGEQQSPPSLALPERQRPKVLAVTQTVNAPKRLLD